MTHSEPAPTVWRARVTTPAFASSQVLHERVQAVFEEDGYPVTLFEEFDGGPWTVEVLFFDGTPEEARTRLAESLGAEGEGLSVSVEALPERNWVEASLEGLAPVEIGRFAVHGRHDRGRITRPVRSRSMPGSPSAPATMRPPSAASRPSRPGCGAVRSASRSISARARVCSRSR